jgi:hypothetical protein
MPARGRGARAGGRPRADARRRAQVALTAFYQTADGADVFPDVYASTFFNQTIDIVETKKLVDVELISLYATIAALLAGLGARRARGARAGGPYGAGRGRAVRRLRQTSEG